MTLRKHSAPSAPPPLPSPPTKEFGKHWACGCPGYSLWMSCFPAARCAAPHWRLRSELRRGTKLSPVSFVMRVGRVRPPRVRSSMYSSATGTGNPVPNVTTVLTPGAANAPRSGSAVRASSPAMVAASRPRSVKISTVSTAVYVLDLVVTTGSSLSHPVVEFAATRGKYHSAAGSARAMPRRYSSSNFIVVLSTTPGGIAATTPLM
mmetsp:Transcript_25044/g.65295  ORF Transcript_25044/g.65295 Transcript_25044/m.65295 type:complete len:206 (-) Transcript_25044:332-949(-)